MDRIVGPERGLITICQAFNPRALLARIRALRRRTLALEAGDRTGERQFKGWRLQNTGRNELGLGAGGGNRTRTKSLGSFQATTTSRPRKRGAN